MKPFFILLVLISSTHLIAADPVLYPVDSPDYDLGHMIKVCGEKRDKKDNCQDSNGFKRRHAIFKKIVINAPVEKVWKVITDLERYKSWNPFMPKLEADFSIGGKIRFVVNLGGIKFPEKLWTQAFEENMRWCWGNKILFKFAGYSQRCRWLKRLGPNKTVYMTTEKFKGAAAPLINFFQRSTLVKGVTKEAKALKYLSEYEALSFSEGNNVCDGDGVCLPVGDKVGAKEIILQKELYGTPEQVFAWISDLPKIQKWLGKFNDQVQSSISTNPYDVGHVRRIKAPFVGVTDETITIFNQPWHVRYRATKSSMLKNHYGDMLLFNSGTNKTDLLWVIKYDSKYKSDKFLNWFIDSYLKKGLRQLRRETKKAFKKK